MLRRTILSAALSLTALLGFSTARGADDHPVVVLDTTAGPITIELDRAKAPITVDNFLKYVDKGFYDGVIFHRIVDRNIFVIQAGGFTEKNGVLYEKRKDALPPIKNESGNGLSNVRGTIAMARTTDPNSATSQFYISLGDNSRLDNYGGGYCVFGKLTSGLDAADAIQKTETSTKPDSNGRPMEDVPTTPITIKSAKRKSNS
jgi:peptidyl-prolyl cis-trans isomerase A (cyclophilin A)